MRTIRSAADAFISQEQLHKMFFIILPAVQKYLFVLLVQLTMFLSLLYIFTYVNWLLVGWLAGWLIG